MQNVCPYGHINLKDELKVSNKRMPLCIKSVLNLTILQELQFKVIIQWSELFKSPQKYIDVFSEIC